METILVKVKKIGGSMMARIPKRAVNELNLMPDETVELTVKKPKKSFLGALKGVGPFMEKDRLDIRE